MANKTITDFTEVTAVAGTDEYETMQGGVTFKGTITKLAAYIATLAQTLTNKTLTTPTIASFTNATHNHSNAAGGGTVAISDTTGTLAATRGGTGQVTLPLAADALSVAEVDVASATTCDIGAAASQNVRITGTTTITGLGTIASGVRRFVRFAGALTFTHNATSLILPSAANITTVAGDAFLGESLGSGNWKILFYQRADGTPLVGGSTFSSLTVTGPITTTPVTISASDIDFSSGTLRMKTLAADTTLTFSNPVEGRAVTVKLTNSSTSYTVTWPTVTWLGGSTPVQSANATDIYNIVYWDGVYYGSQIPGNTVGVEQEAYSAGTVYSLTTTAALCDFGTTDPTITVDNAGTYMIYWGANVKYNAATFAANQTYTIKVRRTNNTAADIANATVTQTTRIITTITDNAGLIGGKPVKYVAAAGDILQIFGVLSSAPAAGSVDVTDAWLVIVRIQ